MKNLLMIALAFFGYSLQAQSELETLYNQSLEAYEQKDYVGFLAKTKAANQLRPNHPSIIYNLAGAYAMNDSLTQSIRVLRQLFLMNPDVQVEEDSDFKKVIDTREYAALRRWIQQNNHPIEQSEQAVSFDQKSLHPEGFDIDPSSGDFYVGGFHDRKIVKVTSEGAVSDWVSHEQVPDLYGVTGVVLDSKMQRIWICTTASPEMTSDDEASQAGVSSVQVYDLEGNLLKSDLIKPGNFFGDLILRKDGSVIISDSQANKIYSFSMGDDLKVWADFSDQLLNVQGIAFDKKENVLFVADYLMGLYRYELATKSLHKMDLPDTVSEKGFDGIYFYKRSIIAIQNGSKPNRVYQFKMDRSQKYFTNVNVIDQALPVFDEPTQGTILKRQFYYIANSPWQHYQDGRLLVNDVPETVILRYKLR